jgi:hypothetical protein
VRECRSARGSATVSRTAHSEPPAPHPLPSKGPSARPASGS